MYFDAVIGHNRIKSQLAGLLARDMLPHSLLFYGEKGLGKWATAQALASEIVGRPVFSSPQGTTYLDTLHKERSEMGMSAKESDKGDDIYVDKGEVFWLRPTTSTGLKISQWQLLLREYLTKASSRKRVIIIEDFQTARPDFANALLKSIEEPPKDVFFILITTKKALTLPTILSRCMLVPFVELPPNELAEAMKKRGYTGNIEDAARLSNGNPEQALLLLEQGSVPTLALAIKILEAIAFDKTYFTRCALWLAPMDREELREVFSWMRILARDMESLRFGVAKDMLRCPMYETQLVKLLTKWNSKALRILCRETLDGEDALRLYIRTALIADGILPTLRNAVEEEL